MQMNNDPNPDGKREEQRCVSCRYTCCAFMFCMSLLVERGCLAGGGAGDS